MNLLSPDSTFGRMVTLLMELLILNFLWLLTSLPLVTLGASTTALYASVTRLLMGEDVHLIRPYFKSFGHYFLRGTGLFLAAADLAGLILFDLWCAAQWDSFFALVCLVVIVASAYFFLMVLSLAFPTLAYFDGKILGTVKQAFLTGIRGRFRPVAVVALNLTPALLYLVPSGMVAQICALWMCIGFAAVAYLNSSLLLPLFDPEKAQELKNQTP